MQNAGCKIEVFPSEMNLFIYIIVRVADTFILHFTSCILHFVVAKLYSLPDNLGGATYSKVSIEELLTSS